MAEKITLIGNEGFHIHAPVNSTTNGFMLKTDKVILDASTAAKTPGTLMERDSNGQAKVSAPTDPEHIARKQDVDTVDERVQYFIDNSGTSVAELLDARLPASGPAFENVRQRLNNTDAQLADIRNYQEIEPEDLRTSPADTDAVLLQRAFDLCIDDNRKMKGIKLGRLYFITSTVFVHGSVAPFLIIRGAGGGLCNQQNTPMIKGGNDNAGGLYFDNVKFQGDLAYNTAPYFDADDGKKLIQITFRNCQVMSTPTLISSSDYLQSIRVINCNFKNMQQYQITTKRVYDMVIDSSLVEFGDGGLINLTQTGVTLDSYCAYGLRIRNCVIESIYVDAPIRLRAVANATIADNYFEGNVLYDIDLTGGDLEHEQLTIKDNNVGSMAVDSEGQVIFKDGAIAVGKIYTDELRGAYNFTNNTGMGAMLFKFLYATASRNINLSKSRHLGGDHLTSNLSIGGFFGQTARKPMSLDTASNIFRFSFFNETKYTITTKKFFVELYYNSTYPNSVAKTTGYVHVIPTTREGVPKLKMIFLPLIVYDGAPQETVDNGIVNSAQYAYISWNSNSSLFIDMVPDGEIIENAIKVSVPAGYSGIRGFVTDLSNVVGY